MKNIVLETNFGQDFHECSKKAKALATKDQKVEFEFNGLTCVVSHDTIAEHLWRDYLNAWTMGWKTIGEYSHAEYPESIAAEFKKRRTAELIKEEKAEKARLLKEQEEKAVFEEKVKGIELELSDAAVWKNYVDLNSDPYGKAAVDYAEYWAKLMQAEINAGKQLKDIAGPTSHELGFMGITGFMYGCAVKMLTDCWKYGEDLRKWHNKEYDHEGDGVVNPAVISISTKD